MKKIFIVCLVLTISLGLFGCGNDSSDDSQTETTTAATETTVAKTEKTVDAVASALGLTGGADTMFSAIGATAGKEFNSGKVEIYQFDTGSDQWKEIQDKGTVSGLKVAASKDGLALLFPDGTEEDKSLIDKFNALAF